MSNLITSMTVLNACMTSTFCIREAIDHGDRSLTRKQWQDLRAQERYFGLENTYQQWLEELDVPDTDLSTSERGEN